MYIPEYIASFKKTVNTKEFFEITEEIFGGDINEIYSLPVQGYVTKLSKLNSCLLMKIAHFLKYYNQALSTEKNQDQLIMFALVSILSCIETTIGTNSRSRGFSPLFVDFFRNYISDQDKKFLIDKIKIYNKNKARSLTITKLAEFILNERNNFIHRSQLIYFALPGTTGTISNRYLKGRLTGMKSVDLSIQTTVAILKKAIIRYLYSRNKNPQQDFRR